MTNNGNTNSDKIAQFLDMTPLPKNQVEIIQSSQQVTSIVEAANTVNQDFETARNNINDLLKTGHQTLDTLFDFVEQAQSISGYEVLVQFIKTMSQTNLDLLELQRKRQQITQDSPTTINNHLHLSTLDVMKIIKKSLKDDDG